MGNKGVDMGRLQLESLWRKVRGETEATALLLGRFLPCDNPVLSLPVADLSMPDATLCPASTTS